jgi:hypothetical protein
MKKTLIAAALALSATAASAWDLTVNANRDITADRNGAGLALGHTVKGVNLAVGVDRFDYKRGNVDLYSLTSSYEVIKVMGVGISPQIGIAYNDSELGRNGWALQPGLALSVPVTKKVALVTEVRRQIGEDKIKYLNGNAVSVGLRTSF